MSTQQKFHLSSDEEDPEFLESNKELEKLNSMWRNLKETKKNLNQANVSSILNKTYLKPNEKSLTYEESESIKEKDQIENPHELHDSRIIPSRDKNSKLMKKLAQANEEIERCHEKIAKERSTNLQKESKIEEITNKFENISYHQKEFLDKSRINNDLFDHEMDKKNKQIERIIESNYQLEESVKYMEIKVVDLEEKNKLLEQSLTLKSNENSRIKSKLSETETTLDELFFNKKAESSALLELEYLKGDVERLLTLLKSTQEFKEFAFNKEGNEIRYLKEISKRINFEINSSQQLKKNSRSCCNEMHSHKNEKYFWVPKESFEFIQKLKETFQGQQLTNEAIERLLFELNKIWMNKENKLKNFYEKEINNVKRHYSSMLSCGDIQAKKTISRLQSQLKLKKENKENLMESKNLLFPFDENKKIDGDAKKEKEYEIKNLKKRIEQLEHEKNENLYDKTIYMEGSYWMSILFLSENFNEFLLKVKKVMKESNLIHTFLNQLETVFKKKLEEIINSISIKEKIDEKNEIFNYYEWIIENLYEVFNTFKDKLANMKENTKQKLNKNVYSIKSKNESSEEYVSRGTYNSRE